MATPNGDVESGLDHASGHPHGPTPVVTAFLWQGPRILLALRSESVSTFPQHWAGISGYIEGDDPLDRALVEIRQETDIPRESVTLRRVGSPILVNAPAYHRQFRVYPLLFAVDDGVEPRQDWEATRFEWVDLNDMLLRARTPTVPQLYDAFQRVWPPWPWRQALEANVDLACQWLRHDRQMGAGTLARAAARELVKLLRFTDDLSRPATREPLRAAAERLRWARPSMAAPVNLLADAAWAIDQSDSARIAIDHIKRLIRQSEEAESKVSQQAAARIAPGWKIMTISYSSTILRTLLAAASHVARVYVCEGRPLLEGRQLAERLRAEGLAVSLLTDAQAFVTMPQIDAVLFGADAILPDGSAINKVGSAQLALAAHQCQKLVFVAADRLKFVRDTAASDVTLEAQPAAEVWPEAPDGIEVLNVYFEAVPAHLITEIISEDGVI